MLPWRHAVPAVFRIKQLVACAEKTSFIFCEETANQIFGIKIDFHKKLILLNKNCSQKNGIALEVYHDLLFLFFYAQPS